MASFDLLSLVEYGGCSAKLPAKELNEALKDLPRTPNKNLLVDIETHDDAGVYKINDEVALIQTTDFFPPVCSDAYDFGQIAATNALSDVYAMGGEVLTALNIVMFPAKAPLSVLKEILKGSTDKVIEAGGVIIGGHTIVDDIPKFGLAVTGVIHPRKIITNAAAKPGDVLILTKPIGGGVILAGKRLNQIDEPRHKAVIDSMKLLNKEGAAIMQKYNIRCATDITGFGLIGHALKLAMASNVSIKLNAEDVPYFDGAFDLIEMACIPGACFRNLEFVEDHCLFEKSLSFNHKMLMLDAQTSGGLLICCDKSKVNSLTEELKKSGFEKTTQIGEVVKKESKSVKVY